MGDQHVHRENAQDEEPSVVLQDQHVHRENAQDVLATDKKNKNVQVQIDPMPGISVAKCLHKAVAFATDVYGVGVQGSTAVTGSGSAITAGEGPPAVTGSGSATTPIA